MESEQDDSSIFMTSLVPIKPTARDEIVWTNPNPCSSLYCRPVQFIIKILIPTECNNNTMSHQLMMTMIDAKVCTYLSEARSNSSCYICQAKPTEMNHLDAVTSNTRPYKFYGMSFTHFVQTRLQKVGS